MVGVLAWMFIAAAVLAAVGVRAVARELRISRPLSEARRRLREGAPRLADHAVVTVTGTVRAHHALLEAPLTGRRVVFHQSVAHVRTLGVQLVACELVPFELETDDGIVRIEGDAAEIALVPVPVIPRSLERMQRFLGANGIGFEHAATAGGGEVAIEPGARIAVHGVARLEADPSSAGERGFREGAPARMTLRAAPGHPLTLGPAP